MSLFRFFSVLFVAGIFLNPLWAQNANVDDEHYLDFGVAGELVIVAGRTPEPAAIVPAQVTVITAEDIAASGATSLPEILAQVPGVRFQGALGGAGSEVISMRGFGENSHGRVLILVDGNRINRPDMAAPNWGAIPLADIERIEVLDGSASVQYGNHAVGGVINIITRRSGDRRTVVGAFGGSFMSHGVSFSHFAPASWGTFSLSAEYSLTDGFRERQASRIAHVSPRAVFFLQDNLTLSLNAFFSYLYYQLPGGLPWDQFRDNPRQVNRPEDENSERHFGGGIALQWFPAANVELNLPLSYRGRFIDADMRFDSTEEERIIHTTEARPQGAVTFDLAGMPLRLLGGVDLSLTRLEVDAYAPWADSITTVSQWGIGPFITARFSPLSTLTFTTGVRFDTVLVGAQFDGDIDDWSTFPTPNLVPVSFNENESFSAFVYEVGVVFNPLQNFRLYARYSTLFRYPSTDEFVEFGGNFNSDLNPERGFNAEIGASYSFGRFLAINANLFFMRLEDEIAFDNDAFANRNLDETQRIGTNIGLRFTPVDFLSFDASYSFVNAIFTAGPFRNNNIPLVPVHKIYANLSVRLPFGLTFGPYIEYASDAYIGNDFANSRDRRLDSWFLLGARARYAVTTNEGREFALQVNARNLLNTNYATMGFAGMNPGVYSFHPADGRSITVSAQLRF